MNHEQIEAIRKREGKATAGPWFSDYQDVKSASTLNMKYGAPAVIAEVIYNEVDDAEFIAHAREDVSLLLAEVERLKHVLNKIRARTFCEDTLDIVDRELVGIAPLTLAEQLEEDDD